MAIRSDEIISIIKSQIQNFDAATETRNVGTVVEVGDGIAQVYGLDAALMSELLEFPGGVMGMALNLAEETVGAVILGDPTHIKQGDTVKTTGRVVEVPVGAGLLGRWRTVSGETIEEWAGLDATNEFGMLAGVFGWIAQDDDGANRTWTLTSPGREAALLGLQLQARTPRNRV